MVASSGGCVRAHVAGRAAVGALATAACEGRAMIAFTIFKDETAGQLERRELSFEGLAEMIEHPPEYPSKRACPFIKLADFGNERSPGGSLRHDANVVSITGVEGDYDGEQVTLAEAAALLRAAGIKAILYTSPSHTAERPRWRILAP